MVYAKLYPSTLVEEYRRTFRAVYVDHHGADSLRNPTDEEWAAFAASCSMRDMGTHLCALPTGEHCARGLVSRLRACAAEAERRAGLRADAGQPPARAHARARHRTGRTGRGPRA
jgi:hypothetical protein